MERLGLHVQDRPVAGLRAPARLLHDEGHRVGLVHQAQLAVRVAGVGRVDVDAPLHQVAVEVGHEGTDVARRVGARGRIVGRLLLHPLDVLLEARLPGVVVALVDRVDVAAVRRGDAGVREQELADGRVEREAVDAVAGRVDEDRGRAVDDIARRNLLAAALERALDGHLPHVVVGDAVDREDGPDGDVDVDVGRAVERVEQDHVLALAVVEEQRDGLGVLLRADQADLPASAEGAHEGLVGEHVELLLLLVLDVDLAGLAEQVHEPGLADVSLDHLRSDGHIAQQTRELALRPGRLRLALDDELLQGDKRAATCREGGPSGAIVGERHGIGSAFRGGALRGSYGPRSYRSVRVASMRAVRGPVSAPPRHSSTSRRSVATSSTS